MIIMRGWLGALARSLAKDGSGWWALANVALRERKLATRLSSILVSATMVMLHVLGETEKWRERFEIVSRKGEGYSVVHDLKPGFEIIRIYHRAVKDRWLH